jgi:hypothetical protein
MIVEAEEVRASHPAREASHMTRRRTLIAYKLTLLTCDNSCNSLVHVNTFVRVSRYKRDLDDYLANQPPTR